jgi:hypothetical protein
MSYLKQNIWEGPLSQPSLPVKDMEPDRNNYSTDYEAEILLSGWNKDILKFNNTTFKAPFLFITQEFDKGTDSNNDLRGVDQ